MNGGSEFGTNQTVLMLIARDSLLEIVDPDVVGRFIHAAREGDVNAVVDMLREGVPVDCCDTVDQTALSCAVFFNHINVVNLLLESGANVNRQHRSGVTPLIVAAMMNYTNVMEVLLHHGADRSFVDEKGKTALDLARLYNHKEAIRLLENY